MAGSLQRTEIAKQASDSSGLIWLAADPNDPNGAPGRWSQNFRWPVLATSLAATELRGEDVDAVIVATFERPEADVEALVRGGIPADKCVTLRRLAPATNGGRP